MDVEKVIFCVLGACFAMGISFGLNLNIGGVQPSSWVQAFVPGFALLRSPFRMGMFVQVFLVGLAGVGVNGFIQLHPSEVRNTDFAQGVATRWVKRLILWIGLVSLLEVMALPVRAQEMSELVSPPKWGAWLAKQPAGAAAMIPFPSGGSVEDFEATTLGMVWALTHGKPLVNGYSGFFPQPYRDLSRVLEQQFPNENGLTQLREAGVKYLIVEQEWLTEGREELLCRLGVERGFEGEEWVVFVVP